MRRKRRTVGIAFLAAVICSVSVGCTPGWLGANVNLNLVVPLGLNGSPGFFNPFGLVQAVVNTLFGIGATGGATTASDPAAAAGAAGVSGGTVGAVLSRKP